MVLREIRFISMYHKWIIGISIAVSILYILDFINYNTTISGVNIKWGIGALLALGGWIVWEFYLEPHPTKPLPHVKTQIKEPPTGMPPQKHYTQYQQMQSPMPYQQLPVQPPPQQIPEQSHAKGLRIPPDILKAAREMNLSPVSPQQTAIQPLSEPPVMNVLNDSLPEGMALELGIPTYAEPKEKDPFEKFGYKK